jgi:hypothetical protein
VGDGVNDDASISRERLLYLARWTGPTRHSLERCETIARRIDEYRASGKSVPPELKRQLAVWNEKLDAALERDELQKLRPDGCWCLGLGGRDPLPLTVVDPTGRILHSEGDETWTTFCSCLDGQREHSRVEQAIVGLHRSVLIEPGRRPVQLSSYRARRRRA